MIRNSNHRHNVDRARPLWERYHLLFWRRWTRHLCLWTSKPLKMTSSLWSLNKQRWIRIGAFWCSRILWMGRKRNKRILDQVHPNPPCKAETTRLESNLQMIVTDDYGYEGNGEDSMPWSLGLSPVIFLLIIPICKNNGPMIEVFS